jgi:hypothetical protein
MASSRDQHPKRSQKKRRRSNHQVAMETELSSERRSIPGISCFKKVSHPQYIVNRNRELEYPSDFLHSMKMLPAHYAELLQPAEYFFYPFTFLLTYQISGMACRTAVNGACIFFRMDVLSNMRRDISFPQLPAQFSVIIMFVSSERSLPLAFQFFAHPKTCLMFRIISGLRHSRIYRKAVTIFHKQVSHIMQSRSLTFGFSV